MLDVMRSRGLCQRVPVAFRTTFRRQRMLIIDMISVAAPWRMARLRYSLLKAA